jgi:hypothetical protein
MQLPVIARQPYEGLLKTRPKILYTSPSPCDYPG